MMALCHPLEQLTQHDSLIVFGISCAVQKGYRLYPLGSIENFTDSLGGVGLCKFRPIALAKLRPSIGVVPKPFTQFRTGSQSFRPHVEFEVCFLYAPRP